MKYQMEILSLLKKAERSLKAGRCSRHYRILEWCGGWVMHGRELRFIGGGAGLASFGLAPVCISINHQKTPCFTRPDEVYINGSSVRL